MILSNNLQIKKTLRSSITLDIDIILKDAMCNIAINRNIISIDIYISNNGSLWYTMTWVFLSLLQTIRYFSLDFLILVLDTPHSIYYIYIFLMDYRG